MNKIEPLLSRENFKNSVFKRDSYKCVFCAKEAVDAHHILDRKLWRDGGYYLSNGASVCEEHHWLCEKTILTVEEVRKQCKIENFVLPDSLEYDQKYDKWGNLIKVDGRRSKGVLFEDYGVKKILKQSNLLYLFY